MSFAPNSRPPLERLSVSAPSSVNGAPPPVRVSDAFAAELLIREAIANCLEHGCSGDPGKHILCVIRAKRGRLVIAVQDEGDGFFDWRYSGRKATGLGQQTPAAAESRSCAITRIACISTSRATQSRSSNDFKGDNNNVKEETMTEETTQAILQPEGDIVSASPYPPCGLAYVRW